MYVKSKRVHKTPFICLKESKLGVNAVLGIYIYIYFTLYIFIKALARKQEKVRKKHSAK